MSGVASTRPAPTLEGLAELARLSLEGSSEAIERILSLARAALDMDVALVGAFDGDFVVQAVDGESDPRVRQRTKAKMKAAPITTLKAPDIRPPMRNQGEVPCQ